MTSDVELRVVANHPCRAHLLRKRLALGSRWCVFDGVTGRSPTHMAVNAIDSGPVEVQNVSLVLLRPVLLIGHN